MKKVKYIFFLVSLYIQLFFLYLNYHRKAINRYLIFNKDYVYKTLIIYPFVVILNLTLIYLIQDKESGLLKEILLLFFIISILSTLLSFYYSFFFVHDIKRTRTYLLAIFLFELTISMPYKHTEFLTILIDFYLSFIWIKLLHYIDRTYFYNNDKFPTTLAGIIGTVLGALIGLMH